MEKTDTRTLLVLKAIKLFKERGVDNVSIMDIVKYSKLTRNAFYYHFSSKEELFDAIGDYLTAKAKEETEYFLREKSAYRKIWDLYRPFFEMQLDMGPDIMNHCNLARSLKGKADNYMFVDEKMQKNLEILIDIAKENGEIKSTAPTPDLAEASYAIVRGNNIKWVLQMGRVRSSWRCEEGSGYPFPSLG